MRFKIVNKGSFVSTLFGISENKEKNFKRCIVCIQEGEKIYKVISLTASRKDGSVSVFFDYCKEKRAFIFRHSHKYKAGYQTIDKSKITDEFEIEFNVNRKAKLSLHKSGFVQLSGKGIKSGIDEKTGRPKGVGVFSSPLDTPVASGPTFCFVCWGLGRGFEFLQKRKPGIQYVILNKEKADFTERYIEPGKNLDSYILEFFIFPKVANKFVYDYKGEPYINHIMHNYMHKPGGIFAHPVIDLRFFDGVISVFPCVQWTGFSEKYESGYSLGSPGGSDSVSEQSKTGYNFHLICPAGKDYSIVGEENVRSLRYEN